MKTILYLLLFISVGSMAQTATPREIPPAWAKSVVWYELFVERFYNGDPKNDPQIEDITIPGESEPPADWTVTPWTSDWHAQEDWAAKTGKKLSETIFFRRYGGDLQGVLMKLDYLRDLGVTALYFRPLNYAPSLHKYDARSYHHIDVNFGPDPQGDKRIIESENPLDPSTWSWTSADKLFLKVIEEAHKRGMRVVMDYSWNHTGRLFWAFQDILKNQEKSPAKNWYVIRSFDNPATEVNEFDYDAWLGFKSLPEIKKVDVTTSRTIGHPYEGNIHPDVKKHIFDVTRRWLAPNGDVSKGIDGYRLDVADHVGLKFWREFRMYVRDINPNAYLVGEIWWEKWPEQLMNPAPYTQGDVFDAVMFYQVYRPARYFFAKTDFEIDAAQFRDSLEFQWNRLSEPVRYAMMNTSSTADAPRLLSDFYNRGKYKYKMKTADDPDYKTGKPDNESIARLKLYLVHAFTNVGAPSIYNGEEMGMWGGDDPDDRKPLWWKDLNFTDETNLAANAKEKSSKVGFNEDVFNFYRKLARIRNANAVLSEGKFEWLVTDGKLLSYIRKSSREQIVVVFNAGTSEKQIPLPLGTWTDLLTNKTIRGTQIDLSPLSAMILKKK